METIALFGGSFDPPHIGHTAIIDALLQLNYIDKIVVMPTFLNPFKSNFHAPSELRLGWLRKIFEEYKRVEVSSYEVDLQRKVPTIETVLQLRKRYKNIFLVIGADNIETFSKWYNYDELMKLVTVIVVSRDQQEVPKEFRLLNVNVDISSTQLRENIDITKLPPKCANEINEFYKEHNAKQN